MAKATVKTPSFHQLLNQDKGEAYLKKILPQTPTAKNHWFSRWYQETGEFGEIYPSQGLLKTPYDFIDSVGKVLLAEEELVKTLSKRHFLLTLFNHPDRLSALKKVDKEKFIAPSRVDCPAIDYAQKQGRSLSVRDLGTTILGTDQPRVSRRALLATGPFVKIGQFGRHPFVGSEMPDIFGSAAALATMAACHCLTTVPRNGIFSDLRRQSDLVKAVFAWLSEEEILAGRSDKSWLLNRWRRNLMVALEPQLPQAAKRAEMAYKNGVRAFRIYSPEPGTDAIKVVKSLRRLFGADVEIFVGQVATVNQAQSFQSVGADGLYVGIGGGGRCITGVRSGSVIDWPELVWQLRGKISLPIIVQGGASDHIAVTLLFGATGIGVSRIAGGGTIESPGGLLYLVDAKNQWFKPYGGEASARTKFLDKKMLPFGIPAFVEGETTRALKSFMPYIVPTLAFNIFLLLEDTILSLVFRGVKTISQLQALNPSPLRLLTASGLYQQNTH
ncbi:hypothetical protein A3A66_02530 [Microgenomates group bacterium RIFCSPLOWO2_01_FULL_46_13]|nr:MAG: hypothetical protein A2783_03215 [Microgenomates group bacterium RIFCSPHIGHO2_01_FULL_45_11]OGV94847.1 MAG: hypothetical protein A3A66_02530 [Microgenomates group bacterium RIFCSPLOWO2_01_FULL_46_13]